MPSKYRILINFEQHFENDLTPLNMVFQSNTLVHVVFQHITY